MLSIYNQKRKQKNIKNNQQGFTLVEVMIVLGIGAAIIALALIVVPTVLRNQRDGQRETAAATVYTEVQNWVTRRNGMIPTGAVPTLEAVEDALADVTLPYYGTVGDDADDDDVLDAGEGDIIVINDITKTAEYLIRTYDSTLASTSDRAANTGQIDVIFGTTCADNTGITNIPKSATMTAAAGYGPTGKILPKAKRSFAVLWATEGNANLFCRDNTQ